MKTLRNSVIAGVAGFAFVAAGALAAPSQAHANNLGAAVFGGLVVGTLLGAAATHNAYAVPVYGAPVYTCSWQTQFVGYNAWGKPVYQKVQIC
jgi:hypothetical protein